MKNILSYRPGSTFKGSEIKKWCLDQIYNNKSHCDEAKRIYSHYIFKDEIEYELQRKPFGPGQDPCRDYYNKISFIKKVET